MQYREVGASARVALEDVCSALDPRLTERDAADLVVASCRAQQLFAPVVLVAGERRVTRFRHALPLDQPLGAHAMLVVCAERHGLYANLTRFVHFDAPDAVLARRFAACDEILERMRVDATKPERTLADAFDDCRRFYAEAGFPDGWRDHHQGGITGYRPREFVATPSTDVPLETGQAFAWNPSLVGAKAEETFVLGDDGPDVVTGMTGAGSPSR